MEPVSEALLISIGTTHPWNIAGVGLDARIAADRGLAAAAVIVAVSAQDASGLRAVESVSPQLLRAQLEALPNPVSAYCVGALISSENARIVAEFLAARSDRAPVVIDPVLRASLGGELQTDRTLAQTLRERMLPLGAIVTPNLSEAALLAGVEARDEAGMLQAARVIVSSGAFAALVTGGHLAGEPVDVLVTASREERISGPRLDGDMRGSGGTLAACLACELASGNDVYAAATRAQAYVRERIAAGTKRGGLQVAF